MIGNCGSFPLELLAPCSTVACMRVFGASSCENMSTPGSSTAGVGVVPCSVVFQVAEKYTYV